MQSTVNSARSLQILAEQSSVYIPVSNKPIKLPEYLSMDRNSLWHSAALQVTGLESMTISSRLRTSISGRNRLQDIEDTINSTGKRRIAKFEMSVADPEVLSEKWLNDGANTEKTSSMTRQKTSESETSPSRFDVDFFTTKVRCPIQADHKRRTTMCLAEQKPHEGIGYTQARTRTTIPTTGSTTAQQFRGTWYNLLFFPF